MARYLINQRGRDGGDGPGFSQRIRATLGSSSESLPPPPPAPAAQGRGEQ
jgi:hypothetical protein